METLTATIEKPPERESTTGYQHPTDSSQLLLELLTLSQGALSANKRAGDQTCDVVAPAALKSMLSALHYRDVGTVEHARRVGLLAGSMAKQLGWEGRELKILEVAALLHDIGKIGVPDSILFKPSALSPDEAELMSLHYNIANDVLQAFQVDPEVLEIVRQCHEHYDRVGYESQHLGTKDAHMGARLLAVADAYDSLATEQVYRAAKSHAEIMQILMLGAGTQFDGNIICSLSRWAEEGRLPIGGKSDGNGLLSAQLTDRSFRGDAAEAGAFCHIFAYLHLLENLYDGFYLVDADRKFVVWNRGVEKLLGHRPQDMLNTTWSNRTLGYCNDKHKKLADKKCPLFQMLPTGKPLTSTLPLLHAKGHLVEVEVQSVPLIDEQGTLRGIAEIFRDVGREGGKSKEYRQLKEAASRDPLTGTANRGELERQLELTVADAKASKESEPFSLVFLDVDHFKSINDNYGHGVGDETLVELAKLLQNETYSGELVARYGGEEFVVVCPGTDAGQAMKRAERLRGAVSKLKIPSMPGHKLTASLGVTTYEPGDSALGMMERADKALYQAKENGRDQSCLFGNEPTVVAEKKVAVQEATVEKEPFTHRGSFFAVIAQDMLVYKLGGFVDDVNAKLTVVTPERVVMQLGSRGVIPSWGKHDGRRPVTLEVVFGNVEQESQKKVARARRMQILTTIRPVGWIRNEDVFQERAKTVFKDLRSFFLADVEE